MDLVIRPIKEKELEKLQEIDKEYYGGWKSPLKVLKNWFEAFPEGFFVAEDRDKIIAYIFVELLRRYEIVPFMHDAKILHDPDGRYMNVSGLGVFNKYRNTGIRKMLGERIIELARSKGCRQILFIIGDGEGIGGHDTYERAMALELGFVKEKHIDKWEIEPEYYVTDHYMWVKDLK